MSAILPPSNFIRDKFGGSFQGRLILWEKQTKRSFAFTADELNEVDAKAAALAPTHDLYFALGTQASRPTYGKRGTADTVAMVPGFVADIDFGEMKDQPNEYPPNEAVAADILSKFPLPPTMIIRTGNGLHVHWNLDKPVQIENAGDRGNAQALWHGFQRVLQRHFADHGHQIDSVGDLARVYRIPGTFNHKSSPPKPVEILTRGEKLTLEAIRTQVADIAPDGIDAQPYEPDEIGPIPLGYSGGDFFFRNQQTGQVVKRSAGQLITMAGLLEMAPAWFWRQSFTVGKKFNHVAACDALVQACRAKGPVNAGKFRGAGVWAEDDRIVVNLGGEQVESDKFVYMPPPEPLELSSDDAPTDALYEFLSLFTWRLKSAAALAFGWVITAPLCGVLPWRPHLAITGPAKAGKSTIFAIVTEALYPLAIQKDGASTEAGIRQHIGVSARPVLLDEFDAKTGAERANIERIVKLMRSASSATAEVARGTPEGKAFNFSVNASFLVAGINIPISSIADSSRIVRLELERPDDPEHIAAASVTTA